MEIGALIESFRRRAFANERLLGTVIASPDLALAEVAAAQFDFLWIDLEHSPLTARDVQGLCIAARAAGCPTIVRVPDWKSSLLTALLDAGVSGVIAPRVESPAVAGEFAAAVRYPPDGRRGVADRRATGYGLHPRARDHDGQAPLCLVQVESAAAVRCAEDLARVDGVDGLIVGPSDLAADLGLTPDLDSPGIRDAIASTLGAAERAGVISGLAAGGPYDSVANALAGTGVTLLAYSADVRIYAQALASAASAMAEAWSAACPNHATAEASTH